MKKSILLVVLALAGTAHADPWDLENFYFRAGVLNMGTSLAKSQPLTLENVSGPASLVINNGPIAGSGVSMDSMTMPAVIVGYTLPWWNRRVSVETILAPPLHATFKATGTLKDMSLAPSALGLPTGVPPLGSQLGETDAAPPIVTAVATITKFGPVQPYAGAGLGVLIAYNGHATNPILTQVSQPNMKIDPAPGLVLQTGLDMQIYKRVTARLDFKYIAFMNANATITNIKMAAPDLPVFGNVSVGSAKMSVELNPVVVMLGIGVAL
jgi:outer membrane protein W